MRNIFSFSDFVSYWKVDAQSWVVETWNALFAGNLRAHFHQFEKMVIFQLQGGSMAKYPFSIAETLIPDGSGDKEIMLITHPDWDTVWTVSDHDILFALDEVENITCTVHFF
jgi:hypothetical protein